MTTNDNKITITEIKSIQAHTAGVLSLLLLKDNRVASSSVDFTINIWDPFNDYHCDLKLEGHSSTIFSICQLENELLVSSSVLEIIIFKISKASYNIVSILENAHTSMIFKVISLPFNQFASCSGDKTIKIWNSDSDIPLQVLTSHNAIIISLIYIKEKKILISLGLDSFICYWSLFTYQCITVIMPKSIDGYSAMYLKDSNNIIIGNFRNCYNLNVDECIIERFIYDDSLCLAVSMLFMNENKDKLIIGCNNGNLFCYDILTKNVTIVKQCHTGYIRDLLKINNNTFLSCSDDNLIKVWNYSQL